MALFSAPGWMMKGGGSAGATISSMYNNDPYKKGKTKVPLKVSNATLTISNNKHSFVLRFTVDQTGFTENAANVELRLRLIAGSHRRYTSVLNTVNLSNEGRRITLNISDQVNKSGQLKQLLTDPAQHNVDKHGKGKCALLFENNTQICEKLIRCEIETV